MSKSSQEILGTFGTPTYISINDPYLKKKKSDAKLKGKSQMMTTHSKSRSAHTDGYFSKTFARGFEKEPTHDAVKARRKAALAARKKMIAGDYRPSHPTKKVMSSGSYEGTLGGTVKQFSPAKQPKKAHQKEKVNFMTNPGKKGTGYGYTGVTLGKMPDYKTSPYDAERKADIAAAKAHRGAVRGAPFRAAAPDGPQGAKGFFDANIYKPTKLAGKPKVAKKEKKVTVPFYPNRPLGSMGSGGKDTNTFGKFTYTPEKYQRKVAKPKSTNGTAVFKPISNSKSMPQPSTLTVNVNRSVNPTNAGTISVL